MPNHVDDFSFSLSTGAAAYGSNSSAPKDHYTVSNGPNNTIAISGSSPNALAYGLRSYLTTYAHADLWWFIGSRLHLAPSPLPKVNGTYHGESIVPWRYHFNTVTFSYTSAFWTWEDWELQLDWMSLHGINLPLAWVGYEKLLIEVFLETGFTEEEIGTFLSGPAFQAWNRFGNIQGSWGGSLPMSWVDSQFALQKQIVARMVELGMTPVLPAFTGFVPRAISRVAPNASFVNGSQWNDFPAEYTNDTFLEPFDPLFAKMQKSFIDKQQDAYGNVSNIYTLDQYNENNPFSGDLDYLRNVTSNTYASLKAADENATWMLQGWLFYSSETFWTNERVEAYLSGVDDDSMLILDLFSESQPQWQRTNSYYGKPWIWCQLHDYGGNMGLYGQVENVTINPIEALNNETTDMVGMGLTMEGQEGNEVMYDLLLDQAWQKTAIDTDVYFHDWVSARYNSGHLPAGLYSAWDLMRQTVYNNTNLATATAVTKSIFVLAPNTTGLVNRTGHHPTTIEYSPATLVHAWQDFYNASKSEPSLWDNAAYTFDLTDITRQVMANAFVSLYTQFVQAANSSTNAAYSPSTAQQAGANMIALLQDLDSVLSASGNAGFSLPDWIASARSWADPSSYLNTTTASSNQSSIADFYEYNARNQITLWGPTGQISDYASKQWAGLIGSYYVPRWRMFVEYTLNSSTSAKGVNEGLARGLLEFEEGWQTQRWGERSGESFAPGVEGDLASVIGEMVGRWEDVFG